MNPWGLAVAALGGTCIYIGAFGTQGRVWQMITGNTALSSSSEAKQLGGLPTYNTAPSGAKAIGAKAK